MRATFKWYIMGFLLVVALLCGMQIILSRPKPMPLLSFNTNAFVSTTVLKLFAPPANPTVLERFSFFFYNALQKLPGGSSTWSFPASPRTNCGVQILLNDCMDVSGTRYLMPLELAVGTVQFGHTNTLDGPQMVAAVETALQSGDVQWWDQPTKQWRGEHLVLLRFPAQKTVVVLPKSAVADFQRSNAISMPNGKGK